MVFLLRPPTNISVVHSAFSHHRLFPACFSVVYQPLSSSIFVILLDNPIDFDNIDNLDVDIVVCLIVPTEETETHLTLLACLSEILDKISTRKKLRSARNSEEILHCLESTDLIFI